MSDIIHSWNEANQRLGKRDRRKIANNTYLERRTFYRDNIDAIVVKLHNTDIIKFYERSPIELNSGGWRTVTTKERINRFSPARVYTEKGIWYVYASSDKFVFHDGIKIGYDGHPINELPDTGSDAKLKAKLDRLVREYINGYCKNLLAEGFLKKEITKPSGGDCWGCYMKGDEKTPNNEMWGFSHYLDHIAERYYVPSLLWKALQNRGNPSVCWHMIEYQILASDIRMAKETLQSFFKRIKPNLFEEFKKCSTEKSLPIDNY